MACCAAWEMGGPPRVGLWCCLIAGHRAGSKVGSAPCNSPPGVWWGPGNWSPWELRRCDPLRGIGLMGYVAKCKRGGVVLCHVFKYRKGRSNSCMRCWTSSYSRAETWNARKMPAIPLGRRTPSAKNREILERRPCGFSWGVLYSFRFKECGERGSSLAPRSEYG